MDEFTREFPQEPPRRRRRKPTKFEIFKVAYLPYLIAAAAVVVILTVSTGAISRSVALHKAKEEVAKAESQAAVQLAIAQEEEASRLLREAQLLADGYDYDGAISLLDSFSGKAADFPQLLSRRDAYVSAKAELVAWSDPEEVPNLSFQLLVADPGRAFRNESYGNDYNRNYVTTDEFSNILQQLYDNGYILVHPSDLVTDGIDDSGHPVLTTATLYLPQGKKPLILTQCGVNYYTYMTDGDDDGLPDKDGAGFASRLVVDENGRVVNEMIDSEGNLLTGAFDLVPILDAFLEIHPDFSYRGAKATLAVTGYDGIFGYRTDSDTEEEADAEYYAAQMAGAMAVVEALRESGYEIACYSYDHIAYGDHDVSGIEEDLESWQDEVEPLLGQVDTLVYPFGSDIGEYSAGCYNDERYQALRSAGFRYFIGLDNDSQGWAEVTDTYFRQTRRLVTGEGLAYAPDIYADLFDADGILNPNRGTVPEE